MWQKVLGTIILFCAFALLQKSFLAHFSFFGVIPDLVFILFFFIVLFGRKYKNYQIVFWAIIAGLFLDIFSYSYIGASIIAFIIIGLLIKRLQFLLRSGEGRDPFLRFVILFIIFFLIRKFLSMIYLQFIDPLHIPITFNYQFIAEILYNLFLAAVTFKIILHVKKI